MKSDSDDDKRKLEWLELKIAGELDAAFMLKPAEDVDPREELDHRRKEVKTLLPQVIAKYVATGLSEEEAKAALSEASPVLAYHFDTRTPPSPWKNQWDLRGRARTIATPATTTDLDVLRLEAEMEALHWAWLLCKETGTPVWP